MRNQTLRGNPQIISQENPTPLTAMLQYNTIWQCPAHQVENQTTTPACWESSGSTPVGLTLHYTWIKDPESAAFGSLPILLQTILKFLDNILDFPAKFEKYCKKYCNDWPKSRKTLRKQTKLHTLKNIACMKEPLETVKGAICKNRSPVEFLLQTTRGQHTTEKPPTAANCSCHNEISSVIRAARTPDSLRC